MKVRPSILLAAAALVGAVTLPTDVIAEDQPQYEIKIGQLKAQATMTTRFRAAADELGQEFGRALGLVFAYVGSRGGQSTGPPFGRYHGMGDGEIDVETGVPVAKTLDGNGTVQPSELPGGSVATTEHVGPYDGLGAAHEALQAWAREHGKTPAGGPWESYVLGPGRESDPSKYRTILYLPLEEEDTPDSN